MKLLSHEGPRVLKGPYQEPSKEVLNPVGNSLKGWG